MPNNQQAEKERWLNVAIVQTVIDRKTAWEAGPRMAELEAEEALAQARDGFQQLADSPCLPHIVLLPELALPRFALGDFSRLCESLGTIGIAGLDYQLDPANRIVRNDAVVVIPWDWPDSGGYRRSRKLFVGKTHSAPVEEALLLDKGWRFRPDPSLWLLDAGNFGRIGVCICYDLMDIERSLLYRSQIHHLLVLSYNKDVEAFYALAGTLSRLVFCNVVICNTGYYGNSAVISPYDKHWKRTLYQHKGRGLASVQIVRLPVAGLDAAQHGIPAEDAEEALKPPPPGFGTC